MAVLLVADDDPIHRETLVAVGKKLGHEILEASCGNEAFQILLARPVDGLITDLRMSPGTGIELLRKIRNRSQELPRIPKIFVNTGIIDGGDGYLKALGALEIWVKPVQPRQILTRLLDTIH